MRSKSSLLFLIHFLRGVPVCQRRQTLFSLLKMLVWGLISLFAVSFLIALVQMLLARWNFISTVPSHGPIPQYLREQPRYRIFLEIVLIAPILEESAFRGILQRKFSYFRIGVITLIYLLTCKVLSLNFYLITIETIVILSTVVLVVFFSKKKLYMSMRWCNRPDVYPWLLWISAFGFGLWHYHNFNFDQANLGAIMINLLPFAVNGLIFAYVSLRAGLWWSIGLHTLNNAWPLLLWF
ncbi:CPBP family glutamic-type intramembrane protease [Mucilaginibacter aquatilis]|uniref:CPBP family intramembrane metalloprotease n=1 Tax=Mucilaginibacter aquatilis TaxID=1517760 RepID=A0A6I4I8J0_9SPHI|nr:CPBP family glutamic-type intramembrane protease [Mucilaginibacter aquatilis]MVN91565.1 CPBP family intramembrane metalloprotease [Mucilaginibacter aquatilis]